MLDLMAQGLPDLFAAFTRNRSETEIRRIQDGIGRSFARLETIAAEASHERISFLATQPELGPLLRTLLRLRHDLVIVGRASATPLPEAFRKRLGPVLDAVARITADYLRQCGERLSARRAPPTLDATEAALDHFAQTIEELRREGLTKSLPVELWNASSPWGLRTSSCATTCATSNAVWWKSLLMDEALDARPPCGIAPGDFHAT